jgi:membrane protease YdiL (CAAX protease family)
MISNTWLRLPVVVRAVVVGMIVQIVGVYSFGLLASLNLKVLPSVPWSLPIELAVLWVLVHYLNGRWWPRSTSASRRERLRLRPVPRRMLPSTVGTGVALGCALFCQGIFSYRLVEMPEAAGGALLAFLSAPPLTAIGIMIAGVVMTGVVEEAAFRGYMQQPIEQRHGPVPAVFLVAVLFAAVHMPPLAILPLFIFGSLGWGVYVRLAGSTLPAMVVHAAIDAVSFALIFLQPDFLPALLTASTLQNGMDAPSWIALSGAVVFGTLTIIGFVRMARCGSVEREEATERQAVLEGSA